MSENDNLQNADGNEELKLTDTNEIVSETNTSETTETNEAETVETPIEKEASNEVEATKIEEESTKPSTEETQETTENSKEDIVAEPEESETINSEENQETTDKTEESTDAHVEEIEDSKEDIVVESEESETINPEENQETTDKSEENTDAHVEEIEASNAEDAEDESNVERHELEDKDYHAMTMEDLVAEFETLLQHQKIQTIKSHINEIKSEFNSKFDALIDEKKEEFINDGGNVIDFYYSNDTKKRFNSAYKSYKSELHAYYKNLENSLKANLENRLHIIEEIKGLINVEENINTTYKHFKKLQENWRDAGPIPRDRYNNAWNTYHHHVERFYDFLHLNRDLRDMDFKHNLEKKLKIIESAEDLAKDDNINRTFRELQVLHKMWKEDLGPVAKEHRDEIWERFSTATKAIHDKRQVYYSDLDKAHEINLGKKEEIIASIGVLVQDSGNSHQSWQKKIKSIESLRQDFFNAGKVPLKVNEKTWAKFKDTVRTFNKQKNAFYKNLKKDQYDNLQKKLDLIKIAEDNKENTDFETVTPLMKKIQNEWKQIGHVPRKDSDKIWKKFKGACNQYFDNFHAERKAADKDLYDAFDKKVKLLDGLKKLDLSGKPEKDIVVIKEKISEWKTLGNVPNNKRYIDGKFNKALDNLFDKLDMDRAKVEMIKFENKLEALSKPDDSRLLDNERNFIRKRMDEIKSEINQLENNLQFFSNASKDSPLVKDVYKNIDKQKNSLDIWTEKLKKIKELY
jgi:hypothetical protein